MLLPPLRPGIKQCYSLPRGRIFPINMRSFAGVAVRTRQRHICHICLATTQSRHNMVKLKATELGVVQTIDSIHSDGQRA